VLCAVSKLNSVNVRSLCSCIVCGRMSLSEFSLLTAQSTAHEFPENGRIYRPKHVGSSLLSVLSINVNW